MQNSIDRWRWRISLATLGIIAIACAGSGVAGDKQIDAMENATRIEPGRPTHVTVNPGNDAVGLAIDVTSHREVIWTIECDRPVPEDVKFFLWGTLSGKGLKVLQSASGTGGRTITIGRRENAANVEGVMRLVIQNYGDSGPYRFTVSITTVPY